MAFLGKPSLRVALGLLAVVSTLRADAIVGSAGASFQRNTWNTGQGANVGDAPAAGQPFFDVLSSDGSACNIGYYIAGSASTTCGNQPGGVDHIGGTAAGNLGPKTKLQYWGVGTSFDTNFYIQPNSPHFQITLLAAAAGRANSDVVGIYFRGPGAPPNIILLNGLTPAIGTTITFTPGQYSFGLFMTTNTPATFYSESSLNSGTDSSWQHFAIFRDAGETGNNWKTLYFGAENTAGPRGTGADFDYNDAIFKISCLSGTCGTGLFDGPPGIVPEPGPAILVAAGVLLLGIRCFRLRPVKSQG